MVGHKVPEKRAVRVTRLSLSGTSYLSPMSATSFCSSMRKMNNTNTVFSPCSSPDAEQVIIL